MAKASLVLVFITGVLVQSNLCADFLKTGGSNFYYRGDKVFLSGVNFAWRNYGYDFGNNQYWSNNKAGVFKDWISKVHSSGGNTIRVWVHVEAESSPKFDSNGYVTATDSSNSLIGELSDLLDYAATQDVFVIIVLFNGALQRNTNVQNMFWDDGKLNSYINNALKPMVNALKSKPALGAWEVLNEPEGTLQTGYDSYKCYDTSRLASSGAGWSNKDNPTSKLYPIKNILKFVNFLTSAIHDADSKALVTVGSWSELSQTDSNGQFNSFKDECLRAAGGKTNGVLDFYQMHTYSHDGRWNAAAPFKVDRWSYNVADKPLLIGEFASVCSENEGIQTLFNYAYNKGYSGALTWHFNGDGHCSDTPNNQMYGLQALKGKNDQSAGKGGKVAVDIY